MIICLTKTETLFQNRVFFAIINAMIFIYGGVTIKTQTTRRQHYVWQYYLEKWKVDNKVWVIRDKKVFQSSTKNIMVETDLYQVHKLNDLEKYIRDEILLNDNRLAVRETLSKEMGMLDSIDIFDFESIKPLDLLKLLTDDYGMKVTVNNELIDINERFSESTQEQKELINEEVKKQYEKFRIQYGESLITYDENDGKEFLEMLLNDDISFFNYENERLYNFYYFIMFKFFRTIKIRKIFINSINKIIPLAKEMKKLDYEADAEKIYSHALHGYVIKAATGFFNEKSNKIMLMKSKDAKFITCDQPVMNISDSLDEKGQVDKMDFYLPISPEKAILIYKSGNDNLVVDVDSKTVYYLNEKVKTNSYQFVVARDKNQLV